MTAEVSVSGLSTNWHWFPLCVLVSAKTDWKYTSSCLEGGYSILHLMMSSLPMHDGDTCTVSFYGRILTSCKTNWSDDDERFLSLLRCDCTVDGSGNWNLDCLEQSMHLELVKYCDNMYHGILKRNVSERWPNIAWQDNRCAQDRSLLFIHLAHYYCIFDLKFNHGKN